MDYFSICLDISGRRCLVIGGGRVAARKVKGLVECGGAVTVITPEAVPELRALAEAGRVAWERRVYQPGDLRGAFLVIAATGDAEVEGQVEAEAARHNILLNVADVPARCNFILPALVRRGDLVLAISTGGKSPALARQLREKLEKEFGTEYEGLVAILGRIRSWVMAPGRPQAENEAIFKRILASEIIDWVKAGAGQRVADHLQAVAGEPLPPELRQWVEARVAAGAPAPPQADGI